MCCRLSPSLGDELPVAHATHGDTARRIEAAAGLVLDDNTQSRAKLLRRDDRKPQARVKRQIPRNITERREGHGSVSSHSSPGADCLDESCPESAASVFGMNVNLFEMRDGGFNDLDVRKAHGNIIRESDPQTALTLSVCQDVLAARLRENGLRRVANQESGSSELYGRQQWQIARPCGRDRVQRPRASHGVWTRHAAKRFCRVRGHSVR